MAIPKTVTYGKVPIDYFRSSHIVGGQKVEMKNTAEVKRKRKEHDYSVKFWSPRNRNDSDGG